jgi:ABC-type polysaccharide/polyol phosphate transport system ATPase subunit
VTNLPGIVFDRVTKSFPRHVGQALLRERILNLLRPGRQDGFLALRDVSFRLEHGESIAVIGPNGAGKSTLLSLAAGLAEPNRGRIEINGRVAALMQLGAGFHPDLTGEENVYINAALMGLSRRQAREQYGAIVDFADIGEFLREPLRTYSSGMMMRLAFAVAVHVDPDILVIDEILGVGDQAFFTKCVGRILQFRHAGKAILCASHAPEMLRRLCHRALWLDHGRLVADGPVDQVLQSYQESAASGQSPSAVLTTT